MYQGAFGSFGTVVNPYTNPTNSSRGLGLVAKLTTTVTTKQVVNAIIAIQKLWAIADGKWWTTPNQPPFPSASVSPKTKPAIPVPDASPANAPWPVVLFQNIPSKNVANNGALTNPNTSCRKSMMLLNWVAR